MHFFPSQTKRLNSSICMTVRISQREMQMEVNTGALVSIVSEAKLKKLQDADHRPLPNHANVKLRTYTGEGIPVLGETTVAVQSSNQSV